MATTKAKKTTKSAKKSAKKVATKTATKRGPARKGTIREKLEVLYSKHGYEDGKAAALKAGYNRRTVQRQMWLIHNGR
jgi:hypothetical protein